MFAQAMTSTSAVTPSSRLSGVRASPRTLLCPCFPDSTRIGFARNFAIVWSLMPFCSGASTSLTIAWYCALSDARACSIETPGRRRAKRYAQYVWRRESPFQPDWSTSFIVTGTKTAGLIPSVVPSNPRGATPTMVIGWPLTIIVWFRTAGFSPNRFCQYAWSSTATWASPVTRSSLASSSRPSAGVRPRTRK